MAKRGFSKMMWGWVIILVAVLFFVSVYGVREGFTDFTSSSGTDTVLKCADQSGNITQYTSSKSIKNSTFKCYTKSGTEDDDPDNDNYFYQEFTPKKKGNSWAWKLNSTTNVQ